MTTSAVDVDDTIDGDSFDGYFECDLSDERHLLLLFHPWWKYA
jgi:hypothetical protein